jgi:hypothetical protein
LDKADYNGDASPCNSEMRPDYSNRSYLLPPGCKDLIDVLRLENPPAIATFQFGKTPPITGEVLISQTTPVHELAALVDQKPFKIIADLIEAGVFAGLGDAVDFEVAARVLKKYGYTAKKAV